MSISPPERIAESLTGVFLAAYVGISLPVVGAGITLARHVTPKVTILGFGIAVTRRHRAQPRSSSCAGDDARSGPADRCTGEYAPDGAPAATRSPVNPASSNSTHNTTNKETQVSDNPNEITIENSVLILIDHQPWVAFSVKSIDAGLLGNNLAGLAASAKALDVPIVLTTVGARRRTAQGPPDQGPRRRHPGRRHRSIDVSTNAWEDIREAVRGNRTADIADRRPVDRGLPRPDRGLGDGRGIPGVLCQRLFRRNEHEAHEDAKNRLVQAGATPINWVAVICEWTPDYTTDERQRVNPPVMKHGSMAGLAVEYLVAQTELLAHAG